MHALGDKWRSLERRKDRQRQAFDAAIELATDLDFQQALEDAREQIDQAALHEVRPIVLICYALLMYASSRLSCSIIKDSIA